MGCGWVLDNDDDNNDDDDDDDDDDDGVCMCVCFRVISFV